MEQHVVPRELNTASAREGEEFKRNALYEALRGQKTPLPGVRTVSTAPVPQVALPDLGGDVVHDDTWSPSSCVRLSWRRKRRRGRRRRRSVWQSTRRRSRRLQRLCQRARLLLEQAGKRRKRKKRRKKKLPKASSSRSSCASHAARTRISGHSSTRPLYLVVLFGVMVLPEEYFGAFPYSAIPGFTMDTVHASVAGAFGYYFTYLCVKVDLVSRGQFSLFRAPMVVFRPEMPRILVGMTRRTVTWRESGSVMCKACFAGFYTSRCIPPVVLKLMMPCIMAGMDQRDSYLVRVWQWHVQCWVFWCFCTLRCVPFSVFRPKMPVFMAGTDHRTDGGSQVSSSTFAVVRAGWFCW